MNIINIKLSVNYIIFKLMSSSLNLEEHNLFDQIWNCNQDMPKLITAQQDPSTNLQNLSSNVSNYLKQIPQIPMKKNTRNQVPKDTNPNLLKNLIVTLRTWVNFKQNNFSKQLTSLWIFFKKSKKINKNLLWLLYGDIKQDLKQLNKIMTLVPQLKEIKIEEYEEIQKIIRNQTLIQLKRAEIQYILKYKRVKNITQFKNYFYKFIKTLQSGNVYCKKQIR